MDASTHDREENEVVFTDEAGKIWFFYGDQYPEFKHPSTVFDIRLISPAEAKRMNKIDQLRPPGKSLGIVEPHADSYDQRGLVPGGKYLYLGTSVYRRDNLQLVSEASVGGHVNLQAFSSTGEHYALVTHTENDDRNGYDRRLRVYDTASGRLLFAAGCSDNLRLLAVSSNGQRVATVNVRSELEVWPLP